MLIFSITFIIIIYEPNMQKKKKNKKQNKNYTRIFNENE
jgi:hypothetical protein